MGLPASVGFGSLLCNQRKDALKFQKLSIFSFEVQNALLKTPWLKGQCHKTFDFWFFHESVSPKHLNIPLWPFRIFLKIRGDISGSRCTTSVNDTSGKWKKSSSRKILIILFGHLWVVELTYIKIFTFKFTLRCLQPDIVPIICHRRCWHRRQLLRKGNWWQNLPPVSLIPMANLPSVSLIPAAIRHRWCT